MEIKQRHLEKLLIESVRYCLGRMTYAVSDCNEIVREYWGQLGKNAKCIIHRDILDEINSHTESAMNNIGSYHTRLKNGYSYLGHESDAFVWIELLNWIEQQEKENETTNPTN